MTTQQVGYRLRNTNNGEIIATWGGAWGQCPGVPSLLIVPQPDIGGEPQLPLQVCGPTVGHTYAGHILEAWMMEEPPAPILPITRRQFFQQAAIAGFITSDEALAAVQTGTIPAIMQAVIDGMPTELQFAAKMLVAGATVFERDHPLTEGIGASLNQTSEQLDAYFRAAALL